MISIFAPKNAACTFDRVGDVADELLSVGVDNAEICLVGRNVGGHDGRFPQIFPAEPKLGGDEALGRCLCNGIFKRDKGGS